MQKVTKILNLIWNEFLYGGHLMALGAASIILVSAVLLNVEISWDILLIVYLLFQSFYIYNRFKEIKIDELTNPERTKYLKKVAYVKTAPIILVVVIVLLLASLIYFSYWKTIIFALFLLVAGLLYTDIFKKLTKKIPLFKDFYVASFFPALVIFLMIYYSYSFDDLVLSILMLAIFFFLKGFTLQFFLDLKDKESDERMQLKTLPVILGEKKTFYLLMVFSIFTAIPIIISLYFGILPFYSIMLFLTIPFNFYCFNLAKQKDYFSYVLASGELILWSILILIGKGISVII